MDNIAAYYQNASDTNPEWEEIISNGTTFCKKNALSNYFLIQYFIFMLLITFDSTFDPKDICH